MNPLTKLLTTKFTLLGLGQIFTLVLPFWIIPYLIIFCWFQRNVTEIRFLVIFKFTGFDCYFNDPEDMIKRRRLLSVAYLALGEKPRSELTLQNMTRKALELFSSNDSPEYVLMVEGAIIDHAKHAWRRRNSEVCRNS